MARRKIRLRHVIRRTRSRSPSRSPILPPALTPLRRPARILRPSSSSPLNKKDEAQKPTDAKKDSPKDVGTDVKKTEAGSSKSKDEVKDQPKRCDKCGQKIK